ncbi:MAG TPA: LamG-like jellyroll fold domain-containing protein [Tepidisphaeraceae bacterium]
MYVTGGRGGDVYHVTNLTDDATSPQPGSLRYGINNTPGSGRTIVFDVGGTIHLSPPGRTGWLGIGKSNLTIAGQTAPGDGITIMGQATKITGNNIILRNMKFRVGQDQQHPGVATDDAIWITGDNVMVDHVSTSWSDDEGISSSDAAGQVTVQYAIVAEVLNYNDHSMGSIIGSDVNGSNISYQHILYAHNRTRLPRLGNETGAINYAEWSNNVIYQGAGYSGAAQPASANFVANTYIQDDATHPQVFTADAATHLYQFGNKMDDDGDSVMNDGHDMVPSNFGSVTREINRFNVPNISYESADVALNHVLDYSGAFWWARDAVDTRIINDTRTTSGNIIDYPDATEWNNAWNAPSFTRPAGWDTDGDGMPNDWETTNGLNPSSAADANVVNPDGYTNLDKYLQYAAHDSEWAATQPDTTPPISSVVALPETTTTTSFTVTWSGIDFGSPGTGIANYDVYASDNGGGYTLWQNATTATSAVYTGAFGHTYSFYTRARDAAGNVEAAPATPDATTHLATVIPPAPTHWWKFDQASGDAPDSVSPGGLTMKITNGPTYSTGYLNNALQLDGVDDYAKVAATALNSSQPFTVMGWVNWNGNTSSNAAVSEDDNSFVLQKRGDDGRFSFTMRTGAPGGAEVMAEWTATPAADTWYHLAGVYTGTEIRLYVNGQLVATTPFSSGFAAVAGASLAVGSDKVGTRGSYWHGKIDDVRTFAQALSTTEIDDIVYPTDTQSPTSSVAPLPAVINIDSFNVSWSGSDTGVSGLKNYDIYVSVDGGPYSLWQDATTATSAAYTVLEGSQFRFYSRARDNAGNLEAAPATPDAQTTVDALPPFVASTQYDFEHNRLVVGFSENVLPSIQVGDIQVQPRGGGSTILPSSFTWDASTNIATFSLASTPPDGNYQLLIPQGTVEDAAHNTLASDYLWQDASFFILAGDANHDRKVNETDLGILSLNWGQTGRTFSQGNFDYSPDGLVNVNDLNILAAHWQQSLAVPVASPLPPAKTPIKRSASRVAQDVLG